MNAAATTVRVIRVFVSSPGDVQAERDALRELVDSINRTDGQSHGFRLELFRWEDHVVPQIGPNPQKVVDAQTPPYDIYLGILKHRFGTPTGRHGSGTEKEFRDASKRWKQSGWPWILFYFCHDPIDPANFDPEQYAKVDKFRKELEKKKQGLYAIYKGARGSSDSLYDKAGEHLRKIVAELLVVQATPEPAPTEPATTRGTAGKIKILFLASLPDDQSRLRLDKEYREIEARIRASQYRDRLELVSRWAVRARDLQDVLLHEKPQIVHFSGHGSATEELILEDDHGRTRPVSKRALTGLFRILKDDIRVVVLNACFSKPQAEAIAEQVGCAVGMKQAIGDAAAIEFASAFYQAIGYERSIQTAFELGGNALELLGIPEEDTPTLVLGRRVDPQRIQWTGIPTDRSDGRGLPKPSVPSEYIRWLLGRCGEVELMGLELTHGSGVRLNHVYTPLATSARSDPERHIKAGRRGQPGEEAEAKVQLLLESLDQQSLYVSGDPGSGKSTFCRWVTWLTCHGEMPEVDVAAPEAYQETFPASLRGRLPILVRLRDFWQHLPPRGVRSIGPGGLDQALERWLTDQKYPGFDWPCVQSHLDAGAALLMLDGVDEVPPVRRADGQEWYPREMLLAGLADAVARWTGAGNRVLVTSRPYGLNAEQQRKLALPHAPILGLDQPLQALLVRRWFVRLKDSPDFGLETAETMIDHVHVERGLDDLAGNPLLLTAMCIIYDQGKRLPHDKYLLYDRIVDTVLHSRYKEKESLDPIRGRLAAIALGMHTGVDLGQQRITPEATASDHELDAILQSYQQLDGATDKGVSDTVRVREDLLSQSGLLVSRAEDKASFYHLSIQEFLAGERLHLLHIRKWDELVATMTQRASVAGWRNTCSFLFGCLVAKTSRHVGVEFLQEFAKRLELPAVDDNQRGQPGGVWNQAIVLGDCLEILSGREAAIPSDLARFFQECVFRAIEQEIAIQDRTVLAVALGRMGDPRIQLDLRIDTNAEDHPGYVKIPAGEYKVGDNDKSDYWQLAKPFDKELIVIASPFWLSKHPVTNSQFAVFIQDGGYSRREFWCDKGWKWVQDNQITAPDLWRNADFNSPNQPVVGVTWWEAEAFCRWAGGFLPTERQWEAAARGPAGLVYPWGDDWESGICNSENKLGRTSAVGIFPRDKSPFGLYDMAGNVCEWCADVTRASHRVIRGGGWRFDSQGCRSAIRRASGPASRGGLLGFRVAAVPLGQVPDRQQTEVAEPGAQAEGRRAQRSGAARPSSRSGRRSGGQYTDVAAK